VKGIIEEEIYLRKVSLGLTKTNYTFDEPISNLKVLEHDIRYQGKSVTAWLQLQAALIAASQPEPNQPITHKFDLRTVTEFEFGDRRVNLRSLSITFHPRTQWLSQIVRLDASTGIYDYLRGRVRLAEGTNSYIINGINFDWATPLSAPPALKDLGVGLLPGEIDVSLTNVEGLNLPSGVEMAKLEDIVRPEDLEFRRQCPSSSMPTGRLPC
jgi:hypothetical protein